MTSSARKPGERRDAAIALIGASAGGPRVLHDLVAKLPRPCAVPVVLVQHMTPMFAQHFIDWLASRSSLPVEEARPFAELHAGVLYVVLRKRSLVFEPREPRRLAPIPTQDAHGPAVDPLLESAARVFGSRVIAALLSGMGDDGARGMKAIADAGGRTLVQSEDSALVYGMPGAAMRLSSSHEALSGEDIARAIASATVGPPRPPWS